LQGNRYQLAREIVLHYTQQQPDTNQVADLGSRLLAAARLVVDTIDFEIAGTQQGRQANLQAQSLLQACQQFQQTVALRSYRPDDALIALHNADRAYQSLQTTLSNPAGTAPSASNISRRIGTMLAEARAAIRPTSSTPTVPTVPSGRGYDAQQLLAGSAAMMRAAQSLSQTLTSDAYQSYSYGIVLRELDTFAARIDAFDQGVRQNATRERLQWEWAGLRDATARIAPQLLEGRPPYFVRLYWDSVLSSLEQVRVALGVTADSSTVLRPTLLHQDLLPLLDQAASQIDVFLAGTNPLVFGIPDVPSVQTNAKNLKTRVLTLRQQAASGEPAQALKQTLTQMVGDYQRAFDRWNAIVASYRLQRPAQLSPVGESLNRVEQMINDALASGSPSTTGQPTQVVQLVATLGAEVTEARRVLTALPGYQEQRSIGLYLEQMSGYVQSIADALSRPTTVDARRQAVAMQGVIGRMQVEIDSLNQRLAAAGTRDQRQRGGDLQLRSDRIAKLVDDIEAQLY
jgi:hypothetical protein